MTNGEKLKAILKPRTDQIRIYDDWVEIEIQSLSINFSCGLDWWYAEDSDTINGLDDFIEFGKKAFGVELTIKKSDNPDTYAKLFRTTKNDLGVQ